MEFALVLALAGAGEGGELSTPEAQAKWGDGLVIPLVLGIFTGYFLISFEQEIWNYGVVAA